MHRFSSSIQPFLLAGFLVFFLHGCGIRQVVVQQEAPTESYPNAFGIEQQVEAQTARINQGFNTGDLEPAMAQGLLETDTMVQALSRRDRAASPSGDLDPSQTAFLNVLLGGNNLALNDALENHQDWVDAFNGNPDYDFSEISDRLLFIALLQSRLHQQERDINAAVQAGNLPPDPALQARQRLQQVRDVEIGDFRQNNALDLSSDQILELQQMADNSGKFIRFLAQGTNGPWPGGAPAPAPGNAYPMEAFANVQSGNQSPSANSPSNGSAYSNSSPANYRLKLLTPTPAPAIPAPTPVPAAPTPVHLAVPTPTPAPQPHFPQPGNMAAAAAPTPLVSYLPPDSLKARDKQLDQLLDAARKQGKGNSTLLAGANQKKKAFHNSLKAFLGQNQQKGLTQDQSDQLSKMLDDFAKSVTDLTVPHKP